MTARIAIAAATPAKAWRLRPAVAACFRAVLCWALLYCLGIPGAARGVERNAERNAERSGEENGLASGVANDFALPPVVAPLVTGPDGAAPEFAFPREAPAAHRQISDDTSVVAASVTASDDPPPHTACREPGERWRRCDECRKGFPHRVAWWAGMSPHPQRYSGYYTGGGAVLFGECRCPDEGTWGVDYDGWFIKKRVWLGRLHGRKEQGGTGAYKTDGPHIKHAITTAIQNRRE